MKKNVTLIGTLFTIYKHFAEFVKSIFTFLLQIQHDNNFLPTSKNRQAKVRRFLRICLYHCFIYCSKILPLENASKRDAMLAPVAK